MHILPTIGAAIALASCAEAFFPWYPPYRCQDDNECVGPAPPKRSEDLEGRDGLSLKLVQRLPSDDIPREVQVTKVVERLSKKYQRGSRVQGNAVERDDKLAKRTNTYSVMTAATPTPSNSAPIDQDGTDYSYFAQVFFGSNNTPLYMLLDTGAGTSWVMGPSCSSTACLAHNSFGAADSTTFKASSTTFSVAYGSGAVSGTLATDSMSVAGMKFNFTFGIANVTSSDFEHFPIDGILGLSYQESQTPNFLDTLVASKALKSNVFGMSLNRAADGPNTGEIDFGAPDSSKYTGNLDFYPVQTNGDSDWAISLGGVGVGTNSSGITNELAYIDTGTSFIFCPPADAATLHALIPGAKSSDGVTYTVPCTTTSSITFTFGSNSYSVLSKDWIGGPAGGVCTSNIYGHAVVPGSWLLGDTFLKNVYSVFDVDQKRIGFAVPKGVTVTPSSSAAGAGGVSSVSAGSTAPSTPLSSGAVPASTFTGAPNTPTTPEPGLSGHQTAGTAAAEASSTSAAATPTKNSGGFHYDTNLLAMAVPAILLAMT